MIDRFIQYIQFEKRYSFHTISSYRSDLVQFQNFLTNEYQLDGCEQATYQMVRSWLAEMMEHKLSARSVNRKKTALQTYYKYLIREGCITENPMSRVLSPKTSKRLPVYVEESQMETLFTGDHEVFSKNFRGIRDRMIMEMFYATGMRLSELVNLKETDIDSKQMTIRILGKRNKERIVPFGITLRKLIDDYLVKRTGILQNYPGCTYFFITEKGKKTYQKLAYRVVNYYLSAITTLEKKSPHVLRHTFATHMLNKGADLNAIKEILGHANLSATQVYTHNTIDKLKNIYKQAHPKA
jgi:integrase/recombinase XerC